MFKTLTQNGFEVTVVSKAYGNPTVIIKRNNGSRDTIPYDALVYVSDFDIKKLYGDFEPETLCWLKHDELGESADADYCEACASALTDWYNGGEKPPQVTGERHQEFPQHEEWHTGNDDDVFYSCAVGGYESDGVCICGLCGALLDYTLLRYGVESELDNFEDHKPSTPHEWYEVSKIIDGVAWLESTTFAAPEDWAELYLRTIKLLTAWGVAQKENEFEV